MYDSTNADPYQRLGASVVAAAARDGQLPLGSPDMARAHATDSDTSDDSYHAGCNRPASHGRLLGHGHTTAFTADVYVTVSEDQADAAEAVIEAFVTHKTEIDPGRASNLPAKGENNR